MTRAYHAARGELEQRNEIITTIQAHPCNAATAAAAGFKVITLMLEEERLSFGRSAQGGGVEPHRRADDQQSRRHGHLQSRHQTVGSISSTTRADLCFYDHANFNGVMTKIKARELGFDACMFMLHKTFGAPKAGGGPAVGAYGCTAELAPFLPTPVITQDGSKIIISTRTGHLAAARFASSGGTFPRFSKSYSVVAHDGPRTASSEASDLSVLANNYMDHQLSQDSRVSRSPIRTTRNGAWR